jgi:hypothetical protein
MRVSKNSSTILRRGGSPAALADPKRPPRGMDRWKCAANFKLDLKT